MTTEIYKSIPGYEGYYEISDLGNVKSVQRFVQHATYGSRHTPERILKLKTDKYGYIQIRLCKDRIHNHYLVHRLVALVFVPNPKNLPQVNHKFGDKSDNRASSLEWVTGKENTEHAILTGLMPKAKRGSESHNAKKIGQYDLGNNLIKVYECIREAEKETGIANGNISACAKNKKNYSHAGGFKWKYV
jgi:hypothetical protein